MIQPEPINARFVGGPLDGETHLMAHRLPFVQVPGPDESFFARLWIERPEDCPAHLLYEVEGADDEETLVYRSLAGTTDRPTTGEHSGPTAPPTTDEHPGTTVRPTTDEHPGRSEAAPDPDGGPA